MPKKDSQVEAKKSSYIKWTAKNVRYIHRDKNLEY